MAEVIDDRHIINRALARLGASPVFSLDEETSKARQAAAIYYDRRDALLGKYQWEFAKKTYRLEEIAENESNGFHATHGWGNGFKYALAMPGDRLSNPRKILTDPRRADFPLRKFLIEGGRVYADTKPLWGTFTARAHPSVWTPAFRLAAIVLVAADLAVPITHDKGFSDALHLEGEGPPEMQGLGGLVGMAIAAEVSGSPGPPPLQMSDDLTTAHMS